MTTQHYFPISRAVLLLFLSGLCALIYQVAWLRELRLVFGASTMASAAVLAIFMGGIGLGSIYLGRAAEKHRNPLRLYGYLELGVATTALLSPFLIALVRLLYLSLGGQATMGSTIALLVRMVMAACVLGLPTFLMGGTLPAMARAVETENDIDRHKIGNLYGFNTIGAVIGIVLATFWLLESLGTRMTLWSGCLLNLLVAVTALYLSRSGSPLVEEKIQRSDSETERNKQSEVPSVEFSWHTRSGLILAGAAVTGGVFLLMEIVWYRLLAPLLGGTTYSFGLILAVALMGIGIGGWLYGRQYFGKRISIELFAFTCALEALFLAIPYALGDRIAIFAGLMRVFGNIGFYGHVAAWIIIITLVVFPAAVVSGFQFPLLIGLLGKGRNKVALHTGHVYAANTAGAIAGSLAGGFGLIPLLGVLGCWHTAVILLNVVAVLFYSYSVKQKPKLSIFILSFPVLLISTYILMTATGPTAAWRHAPIGAGRLDISQKDKNGIKEWINEERRFIFWQHDGKETSVALKNSDGLTFIINGKADGNVYEDAATQIMAPMVGAILHPEPKQALVVGLGTGSSGGWLADIDSMQSVDVIELEPSILEVARQSSPVNRNALDNPKLNIIIGDGREYIQTSRKQYDIIFSEPSNPYRAGIASLYTLEFYQSISERLAQGGIFSQWVQGYEVDSRTILTIYATLRSVFSTVEIWQTSSFDLLFICSQKNESLQVRDLRQKISRQPYRDALLYGWGVTDLEGFLAHYVAQSGFYQRLFSGEVKNKRINTDDRMLVEFGFARMVGQRRVLQVLEMRKAGRAFQVSSPEVNGGEVDWEKVIDNYFLLYMMEGLDFMDEQPAEQEQRMRLLAYRAANRDPYDGNYVIQAWNAQSREPVYPYEIAMLAEAFADQGKMLSLKYVNELSRYWPAMADLVLARYYYRTGDSQKAIQYFSQGFSRLRESPWGGKNIIKRSMRLLADMAINQPEMADKLYGLIEKPLSVYLLEEFRHYTLMKIGAIAGWKKGEAALLEAEPYVPWNKKLLEYRLECYKNTNNPLAEKANEDLDTYRKNEPQPLF